MEGWEICAFDKNHKMKKSLYNHYCDCHQEEMKLCQEKGWYCANDQFKFFPSKIKKEKHDKKCQYCQEAKKKENEPKNINAHDDTTISRIIEEKVPKPKREIDLPIFNFDEFIINDDSKYIKSEDYQKEIEEERNILY